jgi:hypothetical protein
MVFGVLAVMWESGEQFTGLEPGERVAMAELDYPYMPPFVGNDEDLEALAAYLASIAPKGGEE